MTKPTVLDSTLGHLAYDESLNWYEGTIPLPDGTSARLYISLDEVPGAEHAIDEARTLVPTLLSLLGEARSFAADELLDVANEEWRDANDPPVRHEDFMARLRLESLCTYAEGDCEVSFLDGGLFGGHVVMVSWNAEDGFHDADIAG